MPGAIATGNAGATLEMLELDRGYYRTSSTSELVVECHREKACIGGSSAGHYCASGYTDVCETPTHCWSYLTEIKCSRISLTHH